MKVEVATKTIQITADVTPTTSNALKNGDLFIVRKMAGNYDKSIPIDCLDIVTVYLLVLFNGEYWGCDIDGVAPHIAIDKENPLKIFRLRKRYIDYEDDVRKTAARFHCPKGKNIFS